MINLLRKIKINPLFWFVLGIGILTGYFREVVMVFAIVFVHEMGHSIAAHHFKWRIRKIELLPFGGVAEVEEYGNRPLKEEFVVIISGPLQHVWMIALSYLLLPFDFWTTNDHHLFLMHNVMILLFNLLPIWPLDGGKLLYLYFSKTMPFQQSLIITLRSSFALLCLFSIISIYFFSFHLNLWIVIIFLLFSHYFEWKQQSYAYMRFLMERYYRGQEGLLVSLTVSGVTPVQEVLKKFHRGVKHQIIIKESQNKIKEKAVLKAFFEEKKATFPIKSLISR